MLVDLSTCGITFDQGDSITVVSEYKTVNPSWGVNRVYSIGKVGADAFVPNNGFPSNNLGCNKLYNYFETRPISWSSYFAVQQIPSGCGSGIVDYTVYGGIQGVYNNFPNEVRNITTPTVWSIALPNGATVDSAHINIYDPQVGWTDYGLINPASYSSGLVTYDWAYKLAQNGGNVPIHEQYQAYYWYTITMYYSNGCNAVNTYNLPVSMRLDNTPGHDCVAPSATYNSTWPAENYNTGSALSISTSQQIITPNGNKAYWLVNIANNSGSTLEAPWLAKKLAVNGLTITKVWEYACGGVFSRIRALRHFQPGLGELW